jgi:hypothetical protein
MPSCHKSISPPSPPPDWTVPTAQAALGEMSFQLLAMVDTLARINGALLLLQPAEPELTEMLEGKIASALAVEVSGCIECVVNDYLPQVIEALQYAADVSVEQLEQDFQAHQERPVRHKP